MEQADRVKFVRLDAVQKQMLTDFAKKLPLWLGHAGGLGRINLIQRDGDTNVVSI